MLNQGGQNMRALIYATCLCAVSTATVAQDDVSGAVSGTLQPLNAFGEGIAGDVTVMPGDGTVTIRLEAEGVSPGMHLAHIHGFAVAEPQNAACPGPGADTNDDGVVDLIETREVAGVTMIPFTDAPASLSIQSENYPTASEDGRLRYDQSVDVSELRDAVQAAFGTPLALPQRVVFLHGAPEGADLPDSARSLEGVPAAVTIPIACAELDAAPE